MVDVAAAAETSLKTVSRVVNGEPGVTAGLVARVRRAIDLLDYRPDDRARHFRSSSGTTRTIGFVQDDVANPFFAAIFRGLEDVAREAGSLVLSGSSDGDSDRERALVEALIARRVDGIVMVSRSPDEALIRTESGRGTAFVFVDLEPGGLDADLIRTDHRAGARAATDHLLRHGHERIAAIVDDPAYSSARDRQRGFSEAMSAAGLRADDAFVRTGVGSVAAARAAASELLERADAPTAFFTGQNLISIGVLRALHERGQQRHVAQVGFDEVELADVIEPGLSYVPQDPHRLGHLAAEQLFARIGGDRSGPSHVRLPTSVVPRGSGEIAAKR